MTCGKHEPERRMHPSGFPLGPADRRCGECAWRYEGGLGRAVIRCRQSAPEGGHGRRIRDDHPACERFEPAALDCHACGACCREAYDAVTVGARDPVRRSHPELIVTRPGLAELRREGPRCAALSIDGGRYRCTIYDDRPRTCRDFAVRGPHCLTARRRVGLSR